MESTVFQVNLNIIFINYHKLIFRKKHFNYYQQHFEHTKGWYLNFIKLSLTHPA